MIARLDVGIIFSTSETTVLTHFIIPPIGSIFFLNIVFVGQRKSTQEFVTVIDMPKFMQWSRGIFVLGCHCSTLGACDCRINKNLDVDAVLAHAQNVADLLPELMQYCDLMRFEIHGPEAELAKVRGPLADRRLQYFTLEFGFRR